MKISEPEIATNARRFRPAPLRMGILGLLVASIYGGGIAAAVWAGYETVEAAHSGGGVPFFPWSMAFFFVILGMLSVIYAFFFRPREVRLTQDMVVILWWDGNGRAIRRDQVESVKVTGSRIVLRGSGETLKIGPIFSNWKVLGEEIKGWTPSRPDQPGA